MTPARMQRVEASIRTVLAFKDAFNRHDLAGLGQLISDDCLLEHYDPAPEGSVFTGREAVLRFWQAEFQAAPGLELQVEDVFSAGYHAVMRWKLQLGRSAAGAEPLRGVSVFKVREQRICELRSYVKSTPLPAA